MDCYLLKYNVENVFESYSSLLCHLYLQKLLSTLSLASYLKLILYAIVQREIICLDCLGRVFWTSQIRLKECIDKNGHHLAGIIFKTTQF